MKVAVQGEAGSNSHLAALQWLGLPREAGPDIIACTSSRDVFQSVLEHAADLAVLPIENSLYGSIGEHDDLLLHHDVRIVGETALRVRHDLIVMPGVQLAMVKRILSHPVALAQCKQWLGAHADVEAVPFYDTAGGVKRVMAAADREMAAIAPGFAAELYGAQVLVPGIEDHAQNYTRFYVFERSTTEPQPDRGVERKADKASLAFRLKHRPGSLLEALEVFRDHTLNLTRIVSRPAPGVPWEYIFFVDLRYEKDRLLDEAIAKLSQRCSFVRDFGRYRAVDDGQQ